MVIKEISNRRSVREFKEEPVAEEHITEIIKAAQFAPTARNNRAVEFIVVKDSKTKDAIFEVVGQEQMKTAPVLIVPVTDPAKTNCPVEDLSIASENIFLQAASLGLGTVWKNLKTELGEPEKVKAILKIPENCKIINIIPLGRPKESVSPYEDQDFDEKKIHQEAW